MKSILSVKILGKSIILLILSTIVLSGCSRINAAGGQSSKTTESVEQIILETSPIVAPTPEPTPELRFDVVGLLRKSVNETRVKYGDDAVISDEWRGASRYLSLNSTSEDCSFSGILLFYPETSDTMSGNEKIIGIEVSRGLDKLSIGGIPADITYSELMPIGDNNPEAPITFRESTVQLEEYNESGESKLQDYQWVEIVFDNAIATFTWPADGLDRACNLLSVVNCMPQSLVDITIAQAEKTYYVEPFYAKEDPMKSTNRNSWYEVYVDDVENSDAPNALALYGAIDINRVTEELTDYFYDEETGEFINIDFTVYEPLDSEIEQNNSSQSAVSNDGYPIDIGQTVYYSTIMSVNKGIVTAVNESQVTVKWTKEYYNKFGWSTKANPFIQNSGFSDVNAEQLYIDVNSVITTYGWNW